MRTNQVIGVVFLLLIIGGIGFAIYYFDKNSTSGTEEIKIPYNIKILNEKEEEIKGEICVYDEKTFVKCSNFIESWESFNLFQKHNYTFLTKSDGYYTDLLQLNNIDRGNKEITLTKKGNITLIKEGNFSIGDKFLYLTLKSEGKVIRPNICLNPSIGFYSSKIQDYTIDCKEWSNITQDIKYCNTTKQYYRCNSIDNTTCILKQDIPLDLKNKVKTCQQTLFTLENNNITLKLNYNAWELLPVDSIQVFVVDEDIVFKDGVFQYDLSNKIGEFTLK